MEVKDFGIFRAITISFLFFAINPSIDISCLEAYSINFGICNNPRSIENAKLLWIICIESVARGRFSIVDRFYHDESQILIVSDEENSLAIKWKWVGDRGRENCGMRVYKIFRPRVKVYYHVKQRRKFGEHFLHSWIEFCCR